jgi:hypothetical protein
VPARPCRCGKLLAPAASPEAATSTRGNVLGPGAGGIWLAVMFISIFAPVMATGTAPWITEISLASILSVIAGLLLTWPLCNMVKTAFFQTAEPQPGQVTATPTAGPPPAADDAATKLRRPAQLRDSGVITDDDSQARKEDLLSQV